MAKIHVGKQYLVRSFHNQVKSAAQLTDCQNPAMLLLLYAIECGLAAMLLEKRNIHCTSLLDVDDLTHDVNELQEKLGMPPSLKPLSAEHPDQIVHPVDFHSLFRYGGKVSQQDYRNLRTKLEDVMNWLKEQI